jgi:hypothetical protein
MNPRHAVSVTATPEVTRQIEQLRKLFRGAVTTHKILVRATLLGLETLIQNPDRMIDTKSDSSARKTP